MELPVQKIAGKELRGALLWKNEAAIQERNRVPGMMGTHFFLKKRVTSVFLN